MAESKGALIAKSVQKHAGRAKEKVKSYSYYLTCVYLIAAPIHVRFISRRLLIAEKYASVRSKFCTIINLLRLDKVKGAESSSLSLFLSPGLRC